MKARHEFTNLEDYKDYLVAYYAGQAMVRFSLSDDAVQSAKNVVECLNLKSDTPSNPTYKQKLANRNFLNHLSDEQVKEVVAQDQYGILENKNND